MRVRFLLDTNVVSEPVRPRPEPQLLRWLGQWELDDLSVSSITFGEIQKGLLQLQPGTKRDALTRWYEDDVHEQFRDRVLPVDVPVAREWGRLVAESIRAGRLLSVPDGLLLATATIHRLVLVTRNERDCAGRGVDVVNPWNG
jgi:predicted nucleic acid-binding protein